MALSVNVFESILNRFPRESIFVKDNNSNYLAANEVFLSHCGFRTIEQLLDSTDYDLPSADFADQYIHNDHEAIANGQMQILQPTLNHKGEYELVLTQKFAFFDEDTKIHGVVGTFKTVNYSMIKKSMNVLEHANNNTLRISDSLFKAEVDKHTESHLTKRELDVLYYTLHGLSQKQIAAKLGLSVRTVEDHFDHLKAKLRCGNKYQLFGFAIEHGLMNIIPKRLLTKLQYEK